MQYIVYRIYTIRYDTMHCDAIYSMFLKELNYLSIALTGRVQVDVHLKRTSCSSLCQLDLQFQLQLQLQLELQLQQNGDFRALGLACLGFGRVLPILVRTGTKRFQAVLAALPNGVARFAGFQIGGSVELALSQPRYSPKP